ncbi:MAG: DUF6491 family protein [Caulobacteraceae bacterium]
MFGPKTLKLAPVALLAAAALGGASAALAARPAPPRASSCFLSSNWDGWKAPNPSTIFLRVNASQIYRLDLASPTPALRWPGATLVSQVSGSDWICAPIDFQLAVTDDRGATREPVFVKSMVKLSPAEVAALPPADKP